MKKYKYFISYKCRSEFGTGHGNTEVLCDNKIDSIEEIRSIEKDLIHMEHLTAVVIMNYQLMGTVKSDEE